MLCPAFISLSSIKNKMTNTNDFRLVQLLLLIATIICYGQVNGQKNDDSSLHSPKVIQVAPAKVVNWQQTADSGNVQPDSPRYIRQIEDIDSTHRHRPHIIPTVQHTFDPAQQPNSVDTVPLNSPVIVPKKHRRCHGRNL